MTPGCRHPTPPAQSRRSLMRGRGPSRSSRPRTPQRRCQRCPASCRWPAPHDDVGKARRREVPRRWVDPPTSRLSNRTTERPHRARPSHSLSGQAIICVVGPMISTAGGALASLTSCANSLPFAATRPSVRATATPMTHGRSLARDKPAGHIRRPRRAHRSGWAVGPEARLHLAGLGAPSS